MSGFTWGLLLGAWGGGCVSIVVMGLLCASGRQSEAERNREARRRSIEHAHHAHPWADEGTHAGESR